jgi:hypothetical protein
MAWFWARPRMSAMDVGFAVRCDYPSLGTHEFVGFRRSYPKAVAFAARDAAFFGRGPLRMVHSVVAMRLGEFESHARDCRSPQCPTAAPMAGWANGLAASRVSGAVWL